MRFFVAPNGEKSPHYSKCCMFLHDPPIPPQNSLFCVNNVRKGLFLFKVQTEHERSRRHVRRDKDRTPEYVDRTRPRDLRLAPTPTS